MKYIIVFASIFILFIFGAFRIAQSLNNVVDNAKDRRLAELDQFPVQPSGMPSNTLVIVCPQGSTDSDCNYYGTEGLQNAIYDGGQEHTIYLKSGIYNIVNTISYSAPTTDSRSITIVGDGDSTVIHNSQGPNSNAGFSFSFTGDSGITLRNIKLSSSNSSSGIYAHTNVSVFLHHTTFDSVSTGILINNANNLRILNSEFLNNDVAISDQYGEASSTSIYIHNNLFYNNGAAVTLNVNEPFVDIFNNTFYSNEYSIFSHSSGITVTNNIFSNGETTALMLAQAPAEISYNMFYNNGDTCISGSLQEDYCLLQNSYIDVDPQFVSVNTTDLDFHLNGNSPAINSGDPSLTDINGSRSDLGMYGGPGACLEEFGCTTEFPDENDINQDGLVNTLDVVNIIQYVSTGTNNIYSVLDVIETITSTFSFAE